MRDADEISVGIGEMHMRANTHSVLIAPNLGSCLGVAVYDNVKQTGALMHCLVPSARTTSDKGVSDPYRYVDVGMAKLIQTFLNDGSKKTDLTIVAVGCASMNDSNGTFEIGKKNFTIFRKILWKNNLLLKAHDVGGEMARTLTLKMASGEIWLKKQGEHSKLYG